MQETQRNRTATSGNGPEQASPGREKPFWQRRLVIVIGTLLLAGVFYYGLSYLAETLTHESTDDAFLDAHIVSMAPRVAGQVSKVLVTDNQPVKAGDVLVEIDPRDFQLNLDQRRAALKAAEANAQLLQANYDLSQAQLASAQAVARQSAAELQAAQAVSDKAASDLKRAEELNQKNIISPQEFDAAKAAAAAAAADLAAAREKNASNESKVNEAQAQMAASQKAFQRGEALVHQAEWDVQAAELNLSYTKLVAPEDGRVTKKSVEPGDYVQVGQRLMALIPRRLWVTANFKETQLQDIRPGQPVKITIDSVAGRTFSGKVDSIQAGSGARFSLLPPENAVGNFVKVVQRVPVKIVFTEPFEIEHVLGPGMSVVPSVRVTNDIVPELAIIAAAIVLALLAGLVWWWLASRARRRSPNGTSSGGEVRI